MVRNSQMYLDGRGELVLVLDCFDLDRSDDFWTRVLGFVSKGDVGETYRTLVPNGAGVELLLQRVPENKVFKNRLHLDLRTRDFVAEVSRIRALGGVTVTAEPVIEAGWTWQIMADPDGNERCVIEPPDDYWDDEDRSSTP